ncbi:MAG: signal peptidase I [Deltaproteobacteria bacterium]|nr:signal peptidase I [Deltaproteobacteria bacterium]HCH61571.1 signal peptidase I [Deltaproteobacteria bacterium]
MSDPSSNSPRQPNRRNTDVEVAPPEPDSEATEGLFTSALWEILTTWGPAFLVVLVIRSMFIEPFRIPSGSMVPTLAIGDNIVVTKFSYGFRFPLTRVPIFGLEAPERGDVVVFVFPGKDTGVKHWVDLPVPPFATVDYVKRVVGVPGDVVEMRDQILYVNGEAQLRNLVDEFEFVDDSCNGKPTKRYEERFGDKPHEILYDRRYTMTSKSFGPITVPDGEIFVMGDNRDNSFDSRAWNTVPLRNIKGKAQFIWLSWDVCEDQIPFFGDIRTQRMGLAIP